LNVRGVCTCPTGGYKAALKKAVPQGINPLILILDLETVAPAPTDIVSQAITDHEVTFREDNSPDYEEVFIRPCNVTITVEIAR
jgi:hypothetical protein